MDRYQSAPVLAGNRGAKAILQWHAEVSGPDRVNQRLRLCGAVPAMARVPAAVPTTPSICGYVAVQQHNLEAADFHRYGGGDA